jgi:hypothetical protein
VLSLLSSASYAGQVIVPNTFVAGSAAKAAEINANFNSLQSEINDNDARISVNASGVTQNAADIASVPVPKPVVAFDANGVELGSVFGGNTQVISILTAQGYAAEVIASSADITAGDSTGIAFTDTDCGNSGGQAYAGEFKLYMPGTVISASNDFSQSQPLFFVPKPATFVSNITVQSEQGFGGCQPTNKVLQNAQEVFPNDPVITGFPNTAIPAPISIEYR